MNSNLNQLSKINFVYWNSRNPYFSDTYLNSSMRAALTLIKGKGYLNDFNPKQASDYVDCIENKIDSFDMDTPNFKELSYIFDLVQAWGGKMGKMPYTKTNNSTSCSRDKFDDWKDIYLRGVKFALRDSPVEALKQWRMISGLGASFSPKHLRFWTNKYPVLDSRISLLLCGSKRLLAKPEGYQEFLELIEKLSNEFNTNILEMEKALFAFSQNFYLNDTLEMKSKDLLDTTDIHVAKKISSIN